VLRLEGASFKYEPHVPIARDIMILGSEKNSPTLALSGPLLFIGSLYMFHLNVVLKSPSGSLQTASAVQCNSIPALGNLVYMHNVLLTGGGVQVSNIAEVFLKSVAVEDGNVAVRADNVRQLEVSSLDASRHHFNVNKCTTAFVCSNVERIRIMDQKINATGVIFRVAECQTCEIANFVATECMQMGRITSFNPVSLTACDIEAQLPNLETGLRGKRMSLCSDRVKPCTRGEIKSMRGVEDPLLRTPDKKARAVLPPPRPAPPPKLVLPAPQLAAPQLVQLTQLTQLAAPQLTQLTQLAFIAPAPRDVDPDGLLSRPHSPLPFLDDFSFLRQEPHFFCSPIATPLVTPMASPAGSPSRKRLRVDGLF
jgi:hypothetical protein